MHVLVVEDNPADAFLVKEMLANGANATASVAGSLEKALSVMDGEDFDAILLDLSLPDNFGTEIVTKMHTVAGEIPMIVLTGNRDERTALRAVSAGAQDYLLKDDLCGSSLRRSLHYAVERAKSRRALRSSEKRYRKLYENMLAGVYRLSIDGRFLSGNPAMVEIMACHSEPELCALKDVFVNAEEQARLIVELGGGGMLMNFEMTLRRADGRHITVLVNGQEVDQGGHDHGVMEGTLIDITSRKEQEKRLNRLAQIDGLTGLANRYLFDESLSAALARAERRGTELALLFLDLDGFKEINDTLGHDAGDRLLKVAADRISSAMRRGDLVGRLGGDEFGILIENSTVATDLSRVARKLNERVREPIHIEGETVQVSCSIGIATSGHAGYCNTALMKAADLAMYRAKGAGRNTLRFFSSRMQAAVHRQQRIQRAVAAAVARNEFELYYQPQVDLANGAIIGAEALLRISRRSKEQPMPPSEFVPLLEKTGDICAVGHWVLQRACADFRTWQEHVGNEDLVLSVNLSVRQLHSQDIVDSVRTALNESGLSARCLELEITESALMRNTDRCLSVLRELADLGVRVAIDDFGTGFSSLQYLKLMPVNELKIDKSFVDGLAAGREDRAIVRATVALAHSLGLRVTAEGIETPEQARIVRELGCDCAQGFLYYHPAPAEEMTKLLDSEAVTGLEIAS